MDNSTQTQNPQTQAQTQAQALPLHHELKVLRAALHRAYMEIKSSDATPGPTTLLAVARLTNAIVRLTLIQQQVQPLVRTNQKAADAFAYEAEIDAFYRAKNLRELESELNNTANEPAAIPHHEPDPPFASSEFAKTWPYR